jgi:hypothetical protein
VAVPNLQGIKITPTMDNDEMRGFGSLEHLLAVLVGAEVELDFGGIDKDTEVVMTGFASSSSGSGASEQRSTRYEGADNLPYFAYQVQIIADDEGDGHILLPRMKLDSLLPLEIAKENKFAMPNVKAKAVRLRKADNSLYPVFDFIEHATVTALSSTFTMAALS